MYSSILAALSCFILSDTCPENMDEINIVESSCLVSEAHGNAELERVKIVQPRDEWIINRWRIDETHWQEGFERV